ncbi:MAG: ABC transporter ATP-binding protein [Planctomycetota bacterium]|nr:ABC transporter ATP-binding protein [Planctomycetota bacterium]
MALEVSGVEKRYRKLGREISALKGVSLTVEPGRIVAVRGPSGSGKTTLLLVAGGLLRPDAGKVTLDGSDIFDLPPDGRATIRSRSIGFVFQQYHLVPYLSVLDNIRLPALAMPSPDPLGRARELAERMGLSDRARHTPSELSVGERQRVALARAMFNKPQFILADEPTGNLDDRNAGMVLDCLSGHAAGGGAVLLVTHDARALKAAHVVYILEDGTLRAA